MNDLCRWLLREELGSCAPPLFLQVRSFLLKLRKYKDWMDLKDTQLPLNSVVIIMESFYIIDTLYKKKKRRFGIYFVYTVAKICLSCLVPLKHTVYSSMHSSLAFQFLLWKPKFLLWAIYAGSASKGTTALLHANLCSSGKNTSPKLIFIFLTFQCRFVWTHFFFL